MNGRSRKVLEQSLLIGDISHINMFHMPAFQKETTQKSKLNKSEVFNCFIKSIPVLIRIFGY